MLGRVFLEILDRNTFKHDALLYSLEFIIGYEKHVVKLYYLYTISVSSRFSEFLLKF